MARKEIVLRKFTEGFANGLVLRAFVLQEMSLKEIRQDVNMY